MTDSMMLAAALIAVLMVGTWIASLLARDASLVDRIWGLGFALVGLGCWFGAGRPGAPSPVFAMACSLIWGVRLSSYLWWRNAGKGEDYRYVAMRKRWGKSFWLRSLVTVFGVQGVMMWVVSLPLQAAPVGAGVRREIVALGLITWLVGFGCEAVGDAQLAAFKRDPANAGKVMNRGLWAWTRHPNYFGDATLWWGLWLMGGANLQYWWTIVGPVLMTVLVRRVSGVTLLEQSLTKRREGYEEYVRTTPPFVPLPPGTYRAR